MTGFFRLRLSRREAVTRDSVAQTTVSSVSTHYNFTIVSRSFHIVWFDELQRLVPTP